MRTLIVATLVMTVVAGARSEDPPRATRLRFSHGLHADVPGGCGACHDVERRERPGAARCDRCHRDLFASGRCDACHLADADGTLLTDLPGGQLVPRGGHGGDDHGAGWEEGHGRVARAREEGCRVCHRRRSCDRCHRGTIRPLRIHPADWDLSHPGAARAGLSDCDRCHRDQSACLDCHRETGVAESAPGRPVNMRLHPPGYGASHATDVRRNLRACTGCHAEGDCIRCHGAPGIGQGVSPHGRGFGRRCALMKRRNPRPCRKCHPEADLEARCP
jgi:hypothetical protein